MDMGFDKTFSGNQLFTSREELIELICHLDKEQVSGALIIKIQGVERSIFLDNGKIVFAHSNCFEDSLGHYLLVNRKITRDQLEAASNIVRQTGKRLGKVLLEQGVLGYDVLWAAIGNHLKGIVLSCFHFDNGEYSLITGRCLPEENILIDLGIGNLVWEIVRKTGVPRDPDRYLTDLKKIYTTDRSKLDQIDMTPYERHVIVLIERHHELDMIVSQSELLPIDTKRILAVLKIRGLISSERSESNDPRVEQDKNAPPVPFNSFDEALKHYNTLYEMIFKLLKKEIGPIALSISQNSLDEIRESLPGPFKKTEITPEGRLNSEHLLQKTIWFGDMTKKMGDFIGALDEILYAQIFAVRKNLGNDHEKQVLRWVRGDRN